jgi:hypothetical protein
MNHQQTIFQPVGTGRAIELVEAILGVDAQEEQINALLELVAGITDESGCHIRHNTAATVMSYISSKRSNAWLDEVEQLQAEAIAANAS